MDFPVVLQPCPITGILNYIPQHKFHWVLIYIRSVWDLQISRFIWIKLRWRTSRESHASFEDTSLHSLCIAYGNVFALTTHESIVKEAGDEVLYWWCVCLSTLQWNHFECMFYVACSSTIKNPCMKHVYIAGDHFQSHANFHCKFRVQYLTHGHFDRTGQARNRSWNPLTCFTTRATAALQVSWWFFIRF